MNRTERIFTRYLNDDKPLTYPDFDAMWERIEPQLPGPAEKLSPVSEAAPGRGRFRKAALIAAAVMLVAATPVFAALSDKWSDLTFRPGVRSALEQGLGQQIGKTVAMDGAKVTVDTAIVDDNRTVLLFTLDMPDADPGKYPRFSGMTLVDRNGSTIEGNQSLRWNPDSKLWQGEFETDWTPAGLQADVQLAADDLQVFAPVERDIAIDAGDLRSQTIPVGADGIDRLVVRPFAQDDKTLLSTSTFFSDKQAQSWSYPKIGAYDGNGRIEEASSATLGTPGDQGEYTGQQYYRTADLQRAGVTYKLEYTRLTDEIDTSWTFDLHLDKERMLSGTVKRRIGQTIDTAAGPVELKDMTISPTQIRINGDLNKRYWLSYVHYYLDVNGTRLGQGYPQYGDKNFSEFSLRFELNPGMKITADTPITLVMNDEVSEHRDSSLIRLKAIGDQKQTVATKLGNYTVNWTYYRENGNLYVQSESDDPTFGGVNQTYLIQNKKKIPGKPVTANFLGDGNNKIIEMYNDYEEPDADIYVYYYYIDDPDKELRVELQGSTSE